MKKIAFLIVMFFVFLGVVKAEYSCVYDATIPPNNSLEGVKDVEAKIIIKPEENKITADKFLGVYEAIVIDSKIDSNWTESKLIEKLEGKNCPSKVMVCYAKQITVPGSGGAIISAIIMNNTLSSNMNYPFSFSNGYVAYNISNLSQCQIGTANSQKSSGNIIQVEFPCDFVQSRLDKMESLFCKIEDESCTAGALNSYNDLKDELKVYCNQILKYQSYTNDCVTSCLGLQEKITLIEKKEPDVPICGFSEKLILYIANIVKWGKYLVPVIVIILGILDFIKAIAADKDDEMKKAQGRFVKRLIAAALIFIIPFIIEFVLDKMGFDSNGCGIIDL